MKKLFALTASIVATASFATTLDFEGIPSGAITGYEYLANGVYFGGPAGAQVYDYGSGFGITEILTSGDWYSPLVITFCAPGDSSIDAISNTVQFYNHFGPGNGLETDMLQAWAYDINGVQIDYQQLIGDGWLSFAGGIHKVVVDDMQDTAFTIDDLSFQSVPEPGTFAALGIAVPLLFRRRKNS